MPDFYSEPPDAVFRLAAASRLEAVRTTPGFGLVPLPPIVRLEGREAVLILSGIVNGLQTGRAADCARHCAQIAQRKSDGLWSDSVLDCSAHRGPIPGRKRPLFSS